MLFKETKWSPEENKRFEEALALFDKETPERWQNVARLIPGKTESDVINQYQKLVEDISDIEAGVVTDSSDLEWVVGANQYQYHPHFYSPGGGKRCPSNRLLPADHDQKKKGIPWTEEEHRQFLLGLKKYGKGDWRNISRNLVTSRTPTQVASHAQKYFIRQLSGGKDKRRSSIHDITTVHLNNNNNNNDNDATKQTPAGRRGTNDTMGMTLAPKQNNVAKAMYQLSLPYNQQQQQLAAFNLANSSSLMMGMAPVVLHGSSSNYGPHLGTVFQTYLN